MASLVQGARELRCSHILKVHLPVPRHPSSVHRHLQQLRVRQPRAAQRDGPIGALQGGGRAGRRVHCQRAAPAAPHRAARRARAAADHQRGYGNIKK